MYPIRHPSHSLSLPLRGQNHHLRQWGRHLPGSTPLLLLHGWMDVSASWQFMVDALPPAWLAERLIVAPDWRGFGHSRPLECATPTDPLSYGSADHYQFADYLADLDALIAHLNAELGRPAGAAFDVVGHSMGGNVAMLYAGVRPVLAPLAQVVAEPTQGQIQAVAGVADWVHCRDCLLYTSDAADE